MMITRQKVWACMCALVVMGACDSPSDATAPTVSETVQIVSVPEGIEAPGERYDIRAEDLPAPGESAGAVKFPRPEPLAADEQLYLPPGFKAEIFADGIEKPRWLAAAPNGDVFVAIPGARFFRLEDPNLIWIVRDTDEDGVADVKEVFARDFNMPMGMAVVEGALLVSDMDGIWRLPYAEGDLAPQGRERLTADGAMGLEPGSHYHRILALSPDGENMFVSMGSTSNVLEDPMPHASVQRFDKDGSNQMTFASGLRNPIGTAFHPDTGELYVVVNERDGYGDDLVPDFFTRVQEGEFYGWPYAYVGGIPDARFADKRPDLVAKTKMPDVLFQAHSAPVGMVFYDGDQFPQEYRGDAFVALHGSWNRSEPTGYKIVRIPFENGRPSGGYENFLTGFLRATDDGARITGRPAGLAVLPDGSLLLAEDGNNLIWRISYVGE